MICEVCGGDLDLDSGAAPKCSRPIEGFGQMRGELECYRTGFERLRAALAKRDAEWRAAIARARPCGARGLPDAVYGVCQDCRELRTLLDGRG